MITYSAAEKVGPYQCWTVLLDGKRVGKIRVVPNGFQYVPKGGSNAGKVFATISECKRSLESA